MLAQRVVDEFLRAPLRDYSWMKKIPRQEVLEALYDVPGIPEFSDDPWDHQLVCFYIGVCLHRWLYLLDMGLGKTAVALWLAQYRMNHQEFQHGLVCAPSIVSAGEWASLIPKHSNLSFTLAIGTVPEKWERLHANTDLVVIDYHGLQLAVSEKGEDGREVDEKRLRALQQRYKLFIPDEIHKVGRKGTQRFKILSHLTKDPDAIVYALTGTPFGRYVEKVWQQFFLVDRGESMGTSLAMFRQAFLMEKQGWFSVEYKFDPKKEAEFHRHLQNRSMRYEETECQDLPEKVMTKRAVRWGKEQRTHYLEAVEGMVASQQGAVIEAPFVRLRQITSGYLVWKDDNGDHIVYFDENPKMDALLEDIEDMPPGTKMIVYHDYNLTGELICRHLSKAKIKHLWVYGKTKDKIGTLNRFKEDPAYTVLVANPETAGTGPNLQVARYVGFFESPVDPITRKQAEKRAHRSGQTQRVNVRDYVMERSIDLRVLGFLEEGRNLFRALVDGHFSAGSLLKDFRGGG